jgi:hypothetical protein
MPRPKGYKDPLHAGLERILNTPSVSPLTNPEVFKAMISASGQSMFQSFKHIGKKRVDKSKERLETLEQKHEERAETQK